jgi:replicative DNA helicase
MDLLLSIIKTELKSAHDESLKMQIKEFLINVQAKKDLGDLPYVKEKALDFCKRASMQIALEKSISHVATENYEKIIDEIKKAINAGNTNSPGLELLDDIDARYSETYRRTVPTGIRELDDRKILNGGLGAGEIGFVVAPTGVGKTHLLIHIGSSALKVGKNVLHYTFELNERVTSIRYDSHLTDIPSLDCPDNKDVIKQYYDENRKTLGRLIVKYFPTGQASCQTLRSHIDKLQTRGFIPDTIIIDYAGIMRSADRNELLRLELKKVCEELRGLAGELDIPIWSALQSNKEGANSEIVDLTNMAESYGQAHVADFVMGLSRQSAQKATGFGNLFIAKNRAGIDGIKFAIHLDTSRSKARILTDAEAADFARDKEEDALKLMRVKFKELQEEKK